MATKFRGYMRDQLQRYRHLAARYGLSWWVLFVFSIPGTASQVMVDYVRTGGDWGLWWIASAVTLAMTAMAFWVARTLYAAGNFHSARFVYIAYLLLGFIRGLTVYAITQELGLAHASDLGYRITVAPYFALVWFSVSMILVGSTKDYLEARNALAEERATLEAATREASSKLESRRAELQARVLGVVSPALADLKARSKNLSDQAQVDQLLASVQNLADNIVRPLSHRISREQVEIELGQGAHSKARFQIRLPKTISVNLFPSWGAAIAVATLAGPVVKYHGLGFYLQAAPVVAIVVFGVLAAVQSILGWRRISVARAIGIYYLSYLTPAAVSLVLTNGTPLQIEGNEPAMLIALMLFVGTVMLGVNMTTAFQRSSLQRLRDTNHKLNLLEQRVTQQAWMERRRVATVLHGSVQGALYAAAIKLGSSDLQTAASAKAALEAVEAALDSVSQEAAPKVDMVQEMQNQKELWAGAVDIVLNFSDEAIRAVSTNEASSEALVEVLREACNNSVKHGDATRVEVQLTLKEPGLVQVLVTNNGHPIVPSEPNYGSEMFDELTHRWSIRDVPNGVQFWAQMVV